MAAGMGTRLRPITLKTPKCLVEINGKPLLRRWIESLDKCGCEEIIINTHYLSDLVEAYIRKIRKDTKCRLTIAREEKQRN